MMRAEQKDIGCMLCNWIYKGRNMQESKTGGRDAPVDYSKMKEENVQKGKRKRRERKR